MSDFVNHLRFVHNTQTILSLTIMYLVWSSWTSGPELRSDLDRFLRTAEAARAVVEMPERLAGLVPEMPNPHLVLSAEITSTLGYRVLAVNPLRIRSVTSIPNNTSTVGAQWRALQDQEWILQKLGNPEDDLSEVGAWLDERKSHLLRLNRELHAARRPPGRQRPSARDIRRLTTPILLPSVIDWPAEGSSGFAIVELEVYVPMPRRRFRRLCEDLTGIAKYRDLRLARALGIIFDCTTLGPYRFVAQTETVRLPPSMFERYPHLQREFKTIADLLPNDALERAATLQLAGIRRSNPRLLGATIRGEHLGLIGPFLIAIIHLYLLIMLYNLLISVRRGSFDPSFHPWIALMKGPTAVGFSILTLVFLPAIAAILPVWRLTTADGYVAIAIALVLLATGIGIVVFGWEVANSTAAAAVHSEKRGRGASPTARLLPRR